MKKTIPVYPHPERKNNFKIWVNKFRSSSPREPERPDSSINKTLYLRKTGKNFTDNPKNWNEIQIKFKDEFHQKLKLMEEIQLRKIEKEPVNLIYTPRYGYNRSVA